MIDIDNGTVANATNAHLWERSRYSNGYGTQYSTQQFYLERCYFNVAFNGNGATGGFTATQKVWMDASTALTANGFSRTGYTFKGWNTKADGSGTSYSNKQAVTNLTTTDRGSFTLYAQWTPNNYTVAYRQGAATGGWSTTTYATQTRTFPGATTLRTNSMTKSNTTASAGTRTISYGNGTATSGTLPSKGTSTGTTTYKYAPNGWNTGSAWNGGGTHYDSGASFGASSTTNLTLYPQFSQSVVGTTWTAVTLGSNSMSKASTTDYSRKVTFDGNGGSTPSALTATRTRKYTPNGWTTTSGSTTRSYTNGQSVTPTGNMTLYPCFSQATSGGSVTLPTPTRTGYTFNGWYTAASGGTLVGKGGASYTPSADVTLHAHWTANTYTVAYAQGAATGGWSTTTYATQTRTFPGATTLRTNSMAKADTTASAGTRTVTYAKGTATSGTLPGSASSAGTTTYGYTANGWNTKNAWNGGGTHYDSGASFGASSTTNLTLYPQFSQTNKGTSWKAVTLGTNSMAKASTTDYTRKVTFDGNGGSTPSALTATRTRKYTPNGWTTTSGSTTRSYTNGQSVTPSGNLTLYPCFSQSTTGGSVTLPTPARTGYTFQGWYTAASGGTLVGKGGASYTPSADVTLHAQWAINSYYVDWNPSGPVNPGVDVYINGSKVATGATDYYQQHPYGTTYKFVPHSATGYTGRVTSGVLEGTLGAGNVATNYQWVANSYSVKFNANGAAGTMANEGMTYGTAKALTANAFSRTYSVTLDANGGSVSTTSLSSAWAFGSWNTAANGSGTRYADKQSVSNLTATNGGTVTLYAQWTKPSVSLPTPTRAGYTFRGWATSSTATGGTTGSYTPSSNVTLYATWSKDTYSISYDLAGGSVATANPTSYQVDTAEFTLANPTRTGYAFAGWTGTGLSAATTSVTVAKGSTGNRSYKATWTPNTYKVTLDGQGATGAGTTAYWYQYNTTKVVNGTTVYAYSDAALTKPLSGGYYITVPTRTGYAFGGYYTGKSGAGTQYVNASGSMVNNIWSKVAGDTTLYAKWTANSYTVSYDGNGATSGSMADQAATYGQPFMTSRCAYSRPGWTFDGWNERADGTGTAWRLTSNGVYEHGTPWTWTYTSGITLHAQWKKDSYAVSYDLGGGSVATANPTSYQVDTPSFTLVNPTRAGYTFAGWTGTGLSSATAKVTVSQGSTGDRAYVATWAPNTVTVTFQPNGGAGTSTQSFTSGRGQSFGATGISWPGHTLVGWADDARAVGSKAQYSVTSGVGDSWIGNGGTRTLYAVWSANAYAVRYDANGGSGTMADQAMTYDVAADLTANAYTRTGWTFAGWDTARDGTGTRYADRASVRDLATSGTVTLYAQWTKDSYRLTYDLAGGTDGGNPATYSVDTADVTLRAPTRAGYTFRGWTGTGLDSMAKDVTVPAGSTGDRSYVAHWEANAYTVRFDANGGTGTMPDEAMAYDQDRALASSTLSRAGYTLRGWNTERDGTGTGYADGATVRNLAESGTVTLYAQWGEDTYRLTYDLAGGTATEPATYQVTSPDVSLVAPTRDGYTFVGWTGTGVTDPAKEVTIPTGSTGDRSYVAHWTANTYTVRFDANGGSGTMPDEAMAYDQDRALTANAYARDGWLFSGWDTLADGTGTRYADGATVRNLATDGTVTLHAQWSPDPARRSVIVPDEVDVLVLPDGTTRAAAAGATVTNSSPWAVTLQGTLVADDAGGLAVSAGGLDPGSVASGGTRTATVSAAPDGTGVAAGERQAAHIDWEWAPAA